jgi:hypothetical protein
MPRFDQHCLACAWEGEIAVPAHHCPPCPSCGGVTERLWRASARVHGDEILGGVWIENLGPQPLQFHSKHAIVQEARRRGLEPMVRHTPVPGSDKSPHTTSWAAVGPYQMEQARLLLERVGTVTVSDPEPALIGPVATIEEVAQTWHALTR